jgi:hypothetical protein
MNAARRYSLHVPEDHTEFPRCTPGNMLPLLGQGRGIVSVGERSV